MIFTIVDDQGSESNFLKKYLAKYLLDNCIHTAKINTFSSGEEFLANYKEGGADIIFLDIYMSGMNGVDTARKLREIDSKVQLIFCTSSNNHAFESYEVNACFYLLKPYTFESFSLMMNKVMVKRDSDISFKLEDGELLYPAKMIYSEYYNHKITLHQKDGKTITLKLSQAELEQLLAPCEFVISCNRGIIVNIYEAIYFTGETFTMSDGTVLTVSRGRKNECKELYKKYHS